MASFTERMIGAAKLHVPVYEEVEADTTATGQAMAVVLLSSVGAGIGTFGFGAAGPRTLVAGSVTALIGWVIWAFLIMIIGTRIAPEPRTRSNVRELLRATGFAQSPGILRAAGIVPIFGSVIWLGVSLWMLVAMVVAVRQALDYSSTPRAVLVCVIGWLASTVVAFLLMLMFGPPII